MPTVTRAEYAELVGAAFADYAAASLPQATQRAMEFAERCGDGDVDLAVSLGPDAVRALCERGGRTRGSIPAFCTTALKVLGAAQQDDGVRAAVAQLDAIKAREDALAAARREEAAADIPAYSDYLRVLRGHVEAFDPAAATAKATSELIFALLEVCAVPARERTVCPHKQRNGGDVYPGLLFAGVDYDVAAHADGAALVDVAGGGYRIVLGDHTALRSKAAFAVDEPLAPLFPECADLFDVLIEMLAVRRAQLAPGDEPRVFINHQKASAGLWGRNGFQTAWQRMFASLGGPAVGQFRKAVERHAETLYAAGSIDLARRATIHTLCQHKAATAQAAYVGPAGSDNDAAGSGDGIACDDDEAGGDEDEAGDVPQPVFDALAALQMYESSDEEEEEAPPPPAPRLVAPAEPAPPAEPEPEPLDKIDEAMEGLGAASPRIDAACSTLWRMRRRLDELDAAIAQADAKRQRRC
jgi:hypothetical protein